MRQGEGEGEKREREVLPSTGTLPKQLITRAESDQNQKPGSPSVCPTWVVGVPGFVPPSAAYPSTLAGNSMKREIVRTQTSTLIQDAGITSGFLTDCNPVSPMA